MREISPSKRKWVFAGLLATALALAWHNRFVQDDAFISFVYSRNLVEGKGLTWFGTHVEGYSNFLWVLWIALGMKAGIDPVAWAYAGSLFSYAATIFAIWKISFLLFDNLFISAGAVFMFMTNYTASCYATGGLETMSVTALVSAVFYLTYKIIREDDGAYSYTALSLIMALAFLTRMDSFIFIAAAFVCICFYMHKRRLPLRYLLCLLIPFALIGGAWFLFRYYYYGRLLPNSYYVKVALRPDTLINGLLYVWRFFNYYLIWPVILIGMVFLAAGKEGRTMKKEVTRLLLLVFVWALYIVYAGGDFMEFRFMVPAMPFLFIVVSYFAYSAVGSLIKNNLAGLLVSILFLSWSSASHAMAFTGTKDGSIDSIRELATYYDVYEKNDWGRIGRALGENLGKTKAVVAAGSAGAIPYFSGLETVDIWGLNDPDIPRNCYGDFLNLNVRPGHLRLERISVLKKKKVNFIIYFPVILKNMEIEENFRNVEIEKVIPQVVKQYAKADKFERIKDIKLVAMPLEEGSYLVLWYLTPEKEIDELIREKGWKTCEIRILS